VFKFVIASFLSFFLSFFIIRLQITMALRMTLMTVTAPARAVPARTFAKKAAKAKPPAAAVSETVDHTPPLKLFGIPARYANATFTAASKQGCLEQVESELLAFKGVVASKPEFREFLANPTVSRQLKVDAVEKLFDGPKTSMVSKNLFMAMAGNARMADCDKVADCFVDLMKAKRGELDAVVTTAEPLTEENVAFVTKLLKSKNDGKDMSITTAVDPTLIGGLTVKIGDKFIDLSVKSRIDTMTSVLRSA